MPAPLTSLLQTKKNKILPTAIVTTLTTTTSTITMIVSLMVGKRVTGAGYNDQCYKKLQMNGIL